MRLNFSIRTALLFLSHLARINFACMLADAMAVLESQMRRCGPIWIDGSSVLPLVIQQQADADADKIACSAGFDPLAALEKTIHRLPALSHTQSGGFARVQELVPAELRRIITRHGTPAFAAADVMRNAAIRRRRV